MLQRGRLFQNVVRFQRSRGLAKSRRAGQIQRIIEIGPRAVFSKVNPAPASGRTPNFGAPPGAIAETRFRKLQKHQIDTCTLHPHLGTHQILLLLQELLPKRAFENY